MCGILGSIDIALTQSALDLIAPRGPDDSGLEVVDVAAHRVYLGHRRLAIVDLSPAGHQPMATACGRYHLIFNGEVYNHAEIRSGLRQQEFRGHSDTETLLYALAEQGPSAVRNFNGIFGLAFVDTVENRLILARDPYGVKPVYYKQQGSRLVFCSEMKPILSLMPDELDMEAMAELLSLRYLPSPDTLFRGIKKLRPGHVLEIDLGRQDVVANEYSFLETVPAEQSISFKASVERYGELFEQAVERQLMADVEVGVLLSGGVDSALVAASARHSLGRSMKAFTVGFTEADKADETADAAQTSEVLGLEHVVGRIGAEDFFGVMRQCVEIVEEPLATTSVIPMYYLSKLAAESVKVVVSGQGADEPLGGYGRYRGELLAPYFPAALAGPALGVMGMLGIKNDTVLRGLGAAGVRDDVQRFHSSYAVFDDERITSLLGIHDRRSAERIRYYYDLLDCSARRRPVERMMSLDLHLNLADDLLLYTDKITMHHSLECRVPMLDHDLVRFVESLPADHRLRLRSGKRVHKAYAERRLPGTIVHRPKKGFWSPTARWFKDSAFLNEALLAGDSKLDTYFDPKAVSQVLFEHAQGYDRQRQIFLLLAIRHWLDAFV